jgi:hypothetical protein
MLTTTSMDLKEYFLSSKNGSLLKEKSLKKDNESLYNQIVNFGNVNNLKVTFKELVWLFVNSLTDKPKCKVCENHTKFERFSTGYRNYCSISCKSKDVVLKDKIKNIFLERYDGHPMQNDVVKEKTKNTNLKKYGTEFILNSDIVKQKIENTNIEKYGVKRPLLSKDIQNKTKETMLEKHGVEHGLQSKEIHQKTTQNLIKNNDWSTILNKSKETKLIKYGNENYNNQEKSKKTLLEKYGENNPSKIKTFLEKRNYSKLINSVSNYKYGDKITIQNISKDKCEITCLDCQTTTTIGRHFLVMRGNMDRVICTNCNPLNNKTSKYENEITEFLNEYDINYIENDRKILNGLEIDVYLPEYNLAIEFNGLYWHNELYCDKNYHLNKTKMCEKKGIQLIHVFEDEWVNKKEIVLSIIKTKLNLSKKIHARKCEIKYISSKEEKIFLNENHIQGHVNSKIKIGLFYNKELVSVMTFGSLRKALGHKSKENFYEMLRFCNKINYNIIGGASKLFKFFTKNNDNINIISYSDNRYFNGLLYNKLGFKFVGVTKPNYFYVKGLKREHRFKYRKDVLIKDGYDKNKTEHQIMIERGLYRIWDCGNKKWIY